mgnify:CR=1 FL=1
MQVINNDKFIKIIADDGMKITNKDRTIFLDSIFLPTTGDPSIYEEVGRDVWKYFIQEENPDVVELQNITKDIKEEIANLQMQTEMVSETQVLADETTEVVMMALTESDEKHENMADVILCAVDEMFQMIEPIMSTDEEVCISLGLDSETISKLKSTNNNLGNFYVLMVKRGLKGIDEVPIKYRDYVANYIN